MKSWIPPVEFHMQLRRLRNSASYWSRTRYPQPSIYRWVRLWIASRWSCIDPSLLAVCPFRRSTKNTDAGTDTPFLHENRQRRMQSNSTNHSPHGSRLPAWTYAQILTSRHQERRCSNPSTSITSSSPTRMDDHVPSATLRMCPSLFYQLVALSPSITEGWTTYHISRAVPRSLSRPSSTCI